MFSYFSKRITCFLKHHDLCNGLKCFLFYPDEQTENMLLYNNISGGRKSHYMFLLFKPRRGKAASQLSKAERCGDVMARGGTFG